MRTTAGTFTVTPLDDGGRHSEAADDLEASDSEVADDVKTKLRDLSVDYARGEGWLFSESSSDDDSPGSQPSSWSALTVLTISNF